MSELRRFTRFLSEILPACDGDPRNKTMIRMDHIDYMLARTHKMFKWENLPDTIPDRIPELFLQINGHICFTEVSGDLYILTGGLGGPPDPYYMPTLYTVANPALKYSRSLKIGDECIVMPNDSMYKGLMPLFTRYAAAMTETELSIFIASINSRISEIISASDDDTKESAEIYLQNILDGKLGVIGESAFLEGVKVHAGNTGSVHTIIEDLIELEQYQKASWYNELGLNANYNMKRESINSGESQLNRDALLPLVDDMLQVRQEKIEQVNSKYGTNIKIDLASAWKDNEIEITEEQKAINGNSEAPDQEPEEKPATGGDNDVDE